MWWLCGFLSFLGSAQLLVELPRYSRRYTCNNCLALESAPLALQNGGEGAQGHSQTHFEDDWTAGQGKTTKFARAGVGCVYLSLEM